MLPPPIPIPAKQIHQPSIWQLILGSVGLLTNLLVVTLLVAALLFGNTDTPTAYADVQTVSSGIWPFIFFTLLFIPSIVLPIQRLRGKEFDVSFFDTKKVFIGLSMILPWLALVSLGYLFDFQYLPAALLGFLTVVGITLPVIFWVVIGGNRLFVHSTQRAWGVFNFSHSITFIVACFFEIIVFGILLVAAAGWLVQQAEFFPYLTLLQSQGMLTEQNLQSLLTDITPILQTPWIYAGVLLSLSLVVPLIEEFFKPLAVWLFAGKKISPSEGFSLGLLCGAGFALLESLLMTSVAGAESWSVVIIGRAGTALMHISTAALSGWALAKSWQDGRYLRLSGVYLGVVLLHGVWNLFAVLSGLNDLALPIESALLTGLSSIATWVLVGLSLLLVLILVLVNQRLKKENIPPALPGTISQS
jgi:hypothetical protein